MLRAWVRNVDHIDSFTEDSFDSQGRSQRFEFEFTPPFSPFTLLHRFKLTRQEHQNEEAEERTNCNNF
jgi:hypothetical protein